MSFKLRRSQSEILGLAVIMVIVTIGLLIYVRFSLSQEVVNFNSEYNYKQLPVRLNEVLLETHASKNECYGEKMQNLLLKCVDRPSFVCNGGENVCDFVEGKVAYLLNETLNTWNMKYRYTVYKGNDFRNGDLVFPIIKNSNCVGDDISSEIFFFRARNGELVNIKLDLCH